MIPLAEAGVVSGDGQGMPTRATEGLAVEPAK